MKTLRIAAVAAAAVGGQAATPAYAALFRAAGYNPDGALFSGPLPRPFSNDWYSTLGPWTNGEPHSVYADPQLAVPRWLLLVVGGGLACSLAAGVVVLAATWSRLRRRP